MYLARFSYAIRPIDRDRVLELLMHEVEAAQAGGLEARVLIPLTRAPGGAGLQVEIVLPALNDFDTFREVGVGGEQGTRSWARELSDLLTEPPAVELLRISAPASGSGGNATGW